jgi:LPXTG-site transpeptidase (sortase) family protein
MVCKSNHTIRNIFRCIVAFLVILLIWALPAVPRAQANGGVHLSIPTIGVDAQVVTVYIAQLPQGVTWDMSRLRNRLGFLDGTTWFGQTGNAVVGGHSELSGRRPAVFRRLNELQPGAEITVTTNDVTYRYTVTSVQSVPDTDLSPIYQYGDERLTLITCDPNSYNASINYYERRIVVTASRTG